MKALCLLQTQLELLLDLFGPSLKDDDFFLIGGCSLILQQVPGIPLNDIDILVDTETAESLKEQFAAHRLNDFMPADGHQFRSNFSRFQIEGLTVELMGGLEVSCRGNWEKLLIQDFVTFKIGRHFVKTPSLKENIRILQLFGREKDLARARQIEIFLKTNSV